MPVMRGIVAVLLSALVFGAAGVLCGLLLGSWSPAYYRAVVVGGDRPGFDPVQFGVGLGLVQGAVTGVVVGSLLVLALAFARPRPTRLVEGELAGDRIATGRPRWSPARILVSLVALVFAAGCGGLVGFLYGAVVVQLQLYQERAADRLAKVQPILKPPQYADVSADASSDGHVYLSGRVPSQADRKALEDRLRFQFGDEEARSMMGGVGIGDR